MPDDNRLSEVLQNTRIHQESASRAVSVGDAGHWCLKALVDVDAPRLQAAVDAVLKLADGARIAGSITPADCSNACYSGPCDCSGVRRPVAWDLDPDEVRAVITRELTGAATASETEVQGGLV